MYILIGIVLVAIILLVIMYNGLINKKNQVENAFGGMDAQLKKRYDLIPNLLNTVKGYASHERELLEKVTNLREKAAGNQGSLASQAQDEIQLGAALGQLMVRLEAYPDLKASQNFLELQEELANTENRIQAALRFFNGNIRENNNKVQQFPSNILAGMFSFGLREFFELDVPEARQVPKVEF